MKNKTKKLGGILACVFFLGLAASGCSVNFGSMGASSLIEEQISSVAPVSSETTSASQSVVEKKDYSDSFQGINGTAVFYSPSSNTYQIYNQELSEVRSSPCSTFKIVSTLMGLDSGVVISKDSKMGYDGTPYPNPDWERDLTLEEAMKTSCVWYYKKLTNRLTAGYVQETLSRLPYGNGDISVWDGDPALRGGRVDLSGFWLESSLLISPREQVGVVTSIFEGKSSFSQDHVKLLKEMMKQEEAPAGAAVYGKTGTGMNAEGKCVDAWFVGMTETKRGSFYFAVRLDDPEKEGVAGAKAREIAMSIIQKHFS